MPNSFSRFLSDEELQKVRELYLQSLQEAEQESGAEQGPATEGAEGEQPGGPSAAASAAGS
jgi:hypothetical protein